MNGSMIHSKMLITWRQTMVVATVGRLYGEIEQKQTILCLKL